MPVEEIKYSDLRDVLSNYPVKFKAIDIVDYVKAQYGKYTNINNVGNLTSVLQKQGKLKIVGKVKINGRCKNVYEVITQGVKL